MNPRLFVLLFPLIASSAAWIHPCRLELSVDLTGFVDHRTHIVKDNITYSHRHTFYHDGILRGCVCEVKTCVRKCCGLDQTVQDYACRNGTLRSKLSDDFYYIVYRNIAANCTYPLDEFNLLGNGELDAPDEKENDETFKFLEFCLDDVYVDGKFVDQLAMGCDIVEVDEDQHHYTGMIISMPFLLVTFLVYAILPERNLPAKALMCYVLSLLFAYVMLVTIQLANLDPTACTVIAYLCYFFFMVSFFWMNSSCIDIWLTFSGIKGMTGQRTQERKRFMYYSMYSWGLPLIMVCILIWANQSEVLPQSLQPLIGQGQCWFGNQLSTGVYFYFPIAFLVGSNIVLFAITAIKIIRVQRDTKMLNAKDSTKHENDKQRDDVCSDQIYLTNRVENRGFEVYDFLDEDNSCFRFNLYVKLLFAMGVNWSMEIISWAVKWQIPTSGGWIWYLTDFCNAMYGVLIFFIFVFKKNIWVVMKKRYLQFTGKPQQAHRYGLSSTHRTTVSQVTSTSEA